MSIQEAQLFIREKSKTGKKVEPKTHDATILSIGETVRRYDITPRSLHFYEQRGILTSTRQNGARYYDEKQIERLEAILRGKSLGFTLTEIENFLKNDNGKDGRLMLSDRTVIESQLKYLEQRRTEIDHAIAELTASLEKNIEA